ncbi:MAG: Smr/MutS family protein [Gammaproteobacteria bacterium]|jgi:DNA-nicking Smr family endonuclease|nr:Smr/MutS family protein [Gammaproteobacteria bacterium]MBT4462786.1 Smr/MutS family protein [Gammaproteobacteria bacterium]MBT4654338.1 Smr/MutS family protein [Gammaproteobacteria bacterium]MBT5117342.1 Smr/MutS family protein [Gammaproteobacteria bacterium]MBT5761913.1 Smr/MutS family protein [Gammaproteobacteria bacterium]
MNNDKKDKTEFEKLLEESNLDINQILEDKDGLTTNNVKNYINVNVSHDDLYEDNQNIEFSHRKNGVQNKVINDLKSLKYKFKQSEILDLHGLTANEAELELNIFLKDNYYKNSKYLLIIHGKGLNNKDNQAPLKRLVEKFIINSLHILAANSANKNYGGFGATILILKK